MNAEKKIISFSWQSNGSSSKNISLRPFVGQLVILQYTFWNCAIYGLLFVLAIVILRICWAIDDSATVFPYYFPFGKLNLR